MNKEEASAKSSAADISDTSSQFVDNNDYAIVRKSLHHMDAPRDQNGVSMPHFKELNSCSAE